MNRQIEVSKVIKLKKEVEFEVVGCQTALFDNTCSAEFMNETSIVWIGERLLLKLLDQKKKIDASIVITDKKIKEVIDINKQCLLVCKKPKLLYLLILKTFFEFKTKASIHPSSIISEKAKIGKNVTIGPNTYIGESEIGDNVIIEGNNYIYDRVYIDENVIVQAGAVIGSKGMSLARNDKGQLIGFPSLGKVIIGRDVEIGSNTVIDQSVLEETIIGDGTKINSSSFIGNSVQIGKNNYISVVVNINGSVIIGDENFIGSGSTIRNKIRIGNNNTVGAGTVVVKNIENDITVTGNPGIINTKSNGIKL